MPESIHVKIVGADKQALCHMECTIDWSQPETQIQARNELRKRFGKHVKLDFISMEDANDKLRHEKDFPLLLMNDQIRMSGQFDTKKLIEIIETQMEIEAFTK